MLFAFCGFVYQRVTNLLGTQTARLCSIFGTDISQARNNFGHGILIHRTLSGTISAAYGARKIGGTQSA